MDSNERNRRHMDEINLKKEKGEMAKKVHTFKKDMYRKQSIDKVMKKENMFEFFKDYGQRQ